MSHQPPPMKPCRTCGSRECGPVRCRFSTPCEAHPDRAGSLAVDLPSLGIRRHLCTACRSELGRHLPPSPRQAARAGYQGWELFAGRQGITEHAHHNPNAIYERAQGQHLIERGSE